MVSDGWGGSGAEGGAVLPPSGEALVVDGAAGLQKRTLTPWND